MTTPSPLSEVSTSVTSARPSVGDLKLCAMITAFAAIFLCSCSNQTSVGQLNTSTGITVSSIQAPEATLEEPRQIDSIPMLHDTGHLFESLGARELKVMFRDASESHPAPLDSDFRIFAPLR